MTGGASKKTATILTKPSKTPANTGERHFFLVCGQCGCSNTVLWGCYMYFLIDRVQTSVQSEDVLSSLLQVFSLELKCREKVRIRFGLTRRTESESKSRDFIQRWWSDAPTWSALPSSRCGTVSPQMWCSRRAACVRPAISWHLRCAPAPQKCTAWLCQRTSSRTPSACQTHKQTHTAYKCAWTMCARAGHPRWNPTSGPLPNSLTLHNTTLVILGADRMEAEVISTTQSTAINQHNCTRSKVRKKKKVDKENQ